MTPNPQDECREAFEKYARHMDYDLSMHSIEPLYSDETTDIAWDAFRAAWNRTHAAQQPVNRESPAFQAACTAFSSPQWETNEPRLLAAIEAYEAAKTHENDPLATNISKGGE